MDYAFCKVTISPLRSIDSDKSELVSQCLFSDAVFILEKKQKWLKIKTYNDSYIAWVDINHFEMLSFDEFNLLCSSEKKLILNKIVEIHTPWGAQDVLKGSYLPLNKDDIFIIGKLSFKIKYINQNYSTWKEFAFSYLNTPYLWGGKSPFGIDCSAFSQIVFKYRNINIPRDAYQQAELGQEIPFGSHKDGDLAFFQNSEGKIIHVGILFEADKIIHASSWVRVDLFDEKGIYSSQSKEYTHLLKSIIRINL